MPLDISKIDFALMYVKGNTIITMAVIPAAITNDCLSPYFITLGKIIAFTTRTPMVDNIKAHAEIFLLSLSVVNILIAPAAILEL